jgi:hypothetical protein
MAVTSSSPYYRLLCAWKVYEGIGRIRKFLRENADQFGVQTPYWIAKNYCVLDSGPSPWRECALPMISLAA